MKSRIIKKGKSVEKMIKSLKEIDGESISVGYFSEQGKHKSGMTYTSLMALQEFGTDEIPSRPVFQITAFKNPPDKSALVKSSVRKWAKGLISGADTRSLLDGIGEHYQGEIKNLFGDSSVLSPNSPYTIMLKGRDEPLVDTGELKDNLAYKNSIDGKINT